MPLLAIAIKGNLMKKVLATTLLALATAIPQANAWFREHMSVDRKDYCTGFIMAGLSSHEVYANDRTDFWLAFNYLVRLNTEVGIISDPEFQQGQQSFAAATSQKAVNQLVADTDTDCGRGRSGHQVTGW